MRFWRTYIGAEICIVEKSKGVLGAYECKWSEPRRRMPEMFLAPILGPHMRSSLSKTIAHTSVHKRPSSPLRTAVRNVLFDAGERRQPTFLVAVQRGKWYSVVVQPLPIRLAGAHCAGQTPL